MATTNATEVQERLVERVNLLDAARTQADVDKPSDPPLEPAEPLFIVRTLSERAADLRKPLCRQTAQCALTKHW